MNKKAIALLSGGLDSTLAIKILMDQGIEIEAINFVSPFCTCNKKNSCRHEAKAMSEQLGVPLKILPTGNEYIEIIKNPRFGYGKNLNPCIDCRIFMLRKAKSYMNECGASFIITGEVLGQRPKSQRKDALIIIERETELKGLILRPLSAKLLPPTIPEYERIVDRQRLLAIKGRSRKEQISLAVENNFNDYMCGGSGCLLTDKNFVVKLKDLFEFKEDTSIKNIHLLRIGRHFRSSSNYKIIVGKNEEENSRLEQYVSSNDGAISLADEKPGPFIIIPGGGDIVTQKEAAGLCAYYAKAEKSFEVIYKYMEKQEIIEPPVFTKENIKQFELEG